MIQIGDRVVCVDDTKQGTFSLLEKDKEYIINEMKICAKCGTLRLSVNILSPVYTQTTCQCSMVSFAEKGERPFWRSSRFRKVEPRKQIEYVRKEVEVDIEIEEPVLN